MIESGRFLSLWERPDKDLAEYWRYVENLRATHNNPLRVAYSQIVKDEMGSGNILCLGIGTGQLEEMAGIDQHRITGIEVNPDFSKKARKRLPKAQIIRGLIQNEIPRLPHFPYALASDSLDCVNPQELPSILQTLRQKVGKVIVMQTFAPSGEFYAPHVLKEDRGTFTGPGIEGWTHSQLESVSEMLREHGITHAVTERWSLINDVQSAVEANLGIQFPARVADFLDRTGFLYRQIPSYPDIPYPAQVSALLVHMEDQTQGRRQLYAGEVIASPTDEAYARHVSMYTAYQLLRLLVRSLYMDYYFRILGDTFAEAGFTGIETKSISVVGRKIDTTSELAEQLNRSLGFINTRSLPFSSHTRKPFRLALLNGTPLQFFQPLNEPFVASNVRYLVAA